jgi:hypothetical protein
MMETRNRIARHIAALLAPMMVLALLAGGALFMGCSDSDTAPAAASQGEVTVPVRVVSATNNQPIAATFTVDGVAQAAPFVFTQNGTRVIAVSAVGYIGTAVSVPVTVIAGQKVTLAQITLALAQKVTQAQQVTAAEVVVPHTVQVTANAGTPQAELVATVAMPANTVSVPATVEVTPAPATVNPEVPEIAQGKSNTNGTDLALGAVQVKITSTATNQTLTIQQPIVIRVKASALGITNPVIKAALVGKAFPVRIITGSGSAVNIPNATYDQATDEIVVTVNPGVGLLTRQSGGVDIYLMILSGVTINWAQTPTIAIVESRIGARNQGINVSWQRPAVEFVIGSPLLQLIMGLNMAASTTQTNLVVNRAAVQNYYWYAALQSATLNGTVAANGLAASLGLNGSTVSRVTYGTIAETREGTGLLN